ncbi:uncharacterized protein FPRO_07152 [Fusarium proliferatum ET1]|uniref:F-box domain-containing protein n=1 Tax=Fusarium proliferatum (strain ET1) TaxID=1227346 RepID=A0A1L7VA60_FUSPR|nr:uncharacterized protein FPRO_07152 [Fusarium proliferatum ET1]CZR37657.1 uncharacterized protein FPRO_07152 [Fusarium proliferatum ET1]
MDAIPLELVTEIARNLDTTSDISHLRQVSRAFAYAASPVLFHRVQVMNTVECLNQCYEFQKRSPASASFVRHLTLHHAIWPQLRSLDEWSTHPQTLSPMHVSEHEKMHAYFAYRQFIDQEASRTFDTDVCSLTRILSMFPKLTSLTLSHIHAWRWGKLRNDHYEELRTQIRIVPFFKARVEDLAYRLLSVLPNFPQITGLDIPSTLDMKDGEWRVTNENIVSLDVSNLVVRGYEHHQVQSFLQSFPNLHELVLGTESGGHISEQRIALGSLQWQHIRRVHFRHLWTTENDLISFVERHQLQQLVLRNVTLFSGSWESFFCRISTLSGRPLQSAVCIKPSGVQIPLDEAATSYSHWPSSRACSLKPRVYILFGLGKARSYTSASRQNYRNFYISSEKE